MSAFATLERFHCIPEDSLFDPIEKGYKWGEEFGYCWFKTDFVVPDGLGGKDIFIRPHISGYEGTLWVDGVPYGNFSTKIVSPVTAIITVTCSERTQRPAIK